MKNNYYAVIMAGGVGSRFWPISTQKFPKQFHDMLGTGDSLLQRTFKRLSKIIPQKNILIATNGNYKELVLNQLEGIDEQQLLLEPAMRNTAPCILYAALKIKQKDPNAVMIIAPSDHWIENEEEFIRNIETSFKACSNEDILMTLGIQPTHPNTGYGYIEYKKSENEIKEVRQFTEKPDFEIAKRFIESGNYLWNAGIFIWSVKSILKAFETYLPEMFKVFSQGQTYYNTTSENNFIIQPRAMVLGQTIEPFYIEPTGYVNTFAIRFYPYGFANFVSIPIKNLANKETPLEMLFGEKKQWLN